MSVLATFPLYSALQGPFSPLHFYLLALSVCLCVAIILGWGNCPKRKQICESKGHEWRKETTDLWPTNLWPSCVFTASDLTSLALLISFRDVGGTARKSHWELDTQGHYMTHASPAPILLCRSNPCGNHKQIWISLSLSCLSLHLPPLSLAPFLFLSFLLGSCNSFLFVLMTQFSPYPHDYINSSSNCLKKEKDSEQAGDRKESLVRGFCPRDEDLLISSGSWVCLHLEPQDYKSVS